MSLLEIHNLSKSFGGFKAVDNVSTTLREGELTALIGPNGAGKTTFYNLLSGRLKPTSGSVTFRGETLSGLPPHRITQRGVARSFQITNVFAELSVLENVQVALVARQNKGLRLWRAAHRDEELREEGLELLDRLGLSEHAATPCHALPYGEKRLVELALALATRPKLILLDEPAAGMTPEGTKRITQLIRRLADGGEYTFFLTEHDMDVVFDLAERVLVLHHGELLAEGTPDEVRNNSEVRTAYLGEDA